MNRLHIEMLAAFGLLVADLLPAHASKRTLLVSGWTTSAGHYVRRYEIGRHPGFRFK